MKRSKLGCFPGDTQIWCKIDGKVNLYTFEELSDMFNADYGVNNLSDKNIEVLTIDNHKQVVWHKASHFVKNKDRYISITKMNGGKFFYHDDCHSMILGKTLKNKLIKDCTKNSRVLAVYHANENVKISKTRKYYLGFLCGAWMSSCNINNKEKEITVYTLEKANILKRIFAEANIEYTYRENRENLTWIFNTEYALDTLFLEDVDFLAGLIAGALTIDGMFYENKKNRCVIKWNTNIEDHMNIFKLAIFYTGISCMSREEIFERNISIQLVVNDYTCNLLEQVDLTEDYMNMVKNTFRTPFYTNVVSVMPLKETKPLQKIRDTYNFKVNGRIIATNNLILTGDCTIE